MVFVIWSVDETADNLYFYHWNVRNYLFNGIIIVLSLGFAIGNVKLEFFNGIIILVVLLIYHWKLGNKDFNGIEV